MVWEDRGLVDLKEEYFVGLELVAYVAFYPSIAELAFSIVGFALPESTLHHLCLPLRKMNTMNG